MIDSSTSFASSASGGAISESEACRAQSISLDDITSIATVPPVMHTAHNMETWRSGRSHPVANRAMQQCVRWFESSRLRGVVVTTITTSTSQKQFKSSRS